MVDQETKHLGVLIGVCFSLLIASLFAVHAIFFPDEQEKVDAAKAHQLLQIDRQKVEGVIVRAKGQSTTLKYVGVAVGDEWQVVSPFMDEADEGAVALLMGALENVSWSERFEASKASPEQFGLDRPAADVTLLLTGGGRIRLRVGSASALDGTDYVMVDDGPDIFKTKMPIKFALEKDSFELRNRCVLRFLSKGLDLIQAMDGDKKIIMQIRRRRDGHWNVGKPVAARANPTAVQKMLDELDKSKVLAVVRERVSFSESKELFGEPFLHLKATFKDFTTTEYVFAKDPDFKEGDEKDASGISKAPTVIFRRADAPRVYRISSSFLTPFLQGSDALRDKRAVRFDPFEIDAVAMTYPDGKTFLKQSPCPPVRPDDPEPQNCPKSRPWVVDGPVPRPVPKDRHINLLVAILSIEAIEFADARNSDLSAFGLQAPVRSWTVFNSKRKALASLSEGVPQEDGKVWFLAVDAEGETQLLAADPKAVALLPQRASDVEGGSWFFPGAVISSKGGDVANASAP